MDPDPGGPKTYRSNGSGSQQCFLLFYIFFSCLISLIVLSFQMWQLAHKLSQAATIPWSCRQFTSCVSTATTSSASSPSQTTIRSVLIGYRTCHSCYWFLIGCSSSVHARLLALTTTLYSLARQTNSSPSLWVIYSISGRGSCAGEGP